MAGFGWHSFFSVFVPWMAGAVFLIMTLRSSQGDLIQNLATWGGRFWMLLLALLVPPFFVFDSHDLEGKSVDGPDGQVRQLFVESIDAAWEATTSVSAYVLPFAVFPIVVFFVKIVSNYRANCEERQDISKPDQCTRYLTPEQHRQQSRVITWVLKIIIMVFALFALINKVGIPTDSVLNIATVFSLGLSWSMRDWLSSMWGAFMLSFCTELCCGMKISLSVHNAINERPDTMLTVYRPGLMYVVCTKQHYVDENAIPDLDRSSSVKGEDGVTALPTRIAPKKCRMLRYVFVPNSTLIRDGFVLHGM